MALKGNLKIWKVRESGKFKEQQVTYPNNYPDSELAGQTVTSQEPVLEEYIDQEINDAYVIIRMAAIHLEDYDRIVTDESVKDSIPEFEIRVHEIQLPHIENLVNNITGNPNVTEFLVSQTIDIISGMVGKKSRDNRDAKEIKKFKNIRILNQLFCF